MFYFAHPFGGIATPSSTSYSIDPYAGMPTAEKTPHSKHNNPANNRCSQQHLNDFTPWPRQTWQSKDLLSPLIQALQKQIGKLYIYIESFLNNMTLNTYIAVIAYRMQTLRELYHLTYALGRPPKIENCSRIWSAFNVHICISCTMHKEEKGTASATWKIQWIFQNACKTNKFTNISSKVYRVEWRWVAKSCMFPFFCIAV